VKDKLNLRIVLFKIWNIINDIIGKPNKNIYKLNKIINTDGIISESNFEICNIFNDYFINVTSSLDIEHSMVMLYI
jgi:hypothetical protein